MERNIQSLFLKSLKNLDDKDKFKFSLITGGRNNKIILAKNRNKKYIIKCYSNKKISTYNREKFFLKFFYKNNITNVPIYLFSIKNNISVIQFVEGKKIKKIDNNLITHSCNFLNSINKNIFINYTKLPRASDSCFSFQEHINLVKNKIIELKNLVEKKYKNKKIFFFLKNILIPRFNFEEKYLKQNYSNLLTSKINYKEIIISPSDFGFHNMLQGKKPFFIDFEYAGIDDPAKLLCDFICQPDIQLNEKQVHFFLKNFKIKNKNTKKIIQRSKILLNIHRIKWCCVMLNGFLPRYKATKIKVGLNNKIVLEKQLKKSILYFKKYL